MPLLSHEKIHKPLFFSIFCVTLINYYNIITTLGSIPVLLIDLKYKTLHTLSSLTEFKLSRHAFGFFYRANTQKGQIIGLMSQPFNDVIVK